jgi:hypothetical protein
MPARHGLEPLARHAPESWPGMERNPHLKEVSKLFTHPV